MDKDTKRIHLTRYEWPDERQEKRRKRQRFAVIVLVIVLSFGLGLGFGRVVTSPNQVSPNPVSSQLTRLEAIYQVLNEDWYFGKFVDNLSEKLIDDAIFGMVEGTGDIHTDYMTAKETADFAQGIDRGFVGIGVSFFDNNGSYIVERVFISSPAEQAGVQPGDIIFRVDGVDVTGIGTETLVSMVRGTDNTVVVIDFLRGQDIVTLEITRGLIRNTAFGKMVDKDTALLEIYQFGTSTGIEVKQYLDLFKDAKAKTIIFDLRDNGGGYLTALEDVGSLLFEKGAILIQQEIIDGSRIQSKSKGIVAMTFDKVVVLINENTASAAEVLTAALQEHLGATVVGVTSYGKGTVQQQYAFSDGSALKYTVAQWLTPSGAAINGQGITPDIEVQQHPVLRQDFTLIEEDEVIRFDQVHPSVIDVQLALDFLGYDVDRTDGYFSESTQSALQAFQSDQSIDVTGEITAKLSADLRAEVIRRWFIERSVRDLQMIEGLRIVNE